MLRLHMNETSYQMPAEVLDAVLRRAGTDLNRYPEPGVPEVRRRYAAYAGAGAGLTGARALPPEQVVATTGADEAIDLTVLALRQVVRQVIVMPPTFTEYARAARLAGLDVVEVPLTGGWSIDVEGLVAAARRAPSLVFICSPNNPTGNCVAVREALEALDALDDPGAQRDEAGGTWVAVDEAYWEFAGETLLPELARRPRLVILRTMSKAFCLAGIRMGFALAGPELARRFDGTRMYFNIGSLTAAVAAAALAEPGYVRDVVEAVRAGRDRLTAGLRSIPGLHPYPSLTNFVLCRTGRPGPDIARELEERGILVRAYPSAPALKHHLRITVGTPQEVERCLDALRAVPVSG